MGRSKQSDLSCILMLPGIFGVYFSIPFFTSPRAPITTGIAVGFHSSYSLDLDFKVGFPLFFWSVIRDDQMNE